MRAEQFAIVETVGLLRQVTVQIVTSADLSQALDRLADLASDLAPGPTWCGISILRDGQPALAAYSGDLPTVLEEEQYRQGEGPCLTAMSNRDVVISDDLTVEHRWPAWCRLAVDRGVRSVVCYPLDIDAQVCGALNLYPSTGVPLTPSVHLTAMLVAEQAGLLLGEVLGRSRDRARIERLHAGIGTHRSEIDRAVGIVMAQRGCDEREAMTVLEKAAKAVGADLSSVAAKLVATVASRAKKQ